MPREVWFVIGAVIAVPLVIRLLSSLGKGEANPNLSSKGWPGEHTLGTVAQWPSVDMDFWMNASPEDLAVERLDGAWVIDPAIFSQGNSDNRPRRT